MSTMEISYFELDALVGTELGPSEYLNVSQHDIDTFADLTNDHYWLHVDPERASESAYGSTIVHGFLTLALVSALWPQLLWVTDSPMQVNYGLDRVRFTAPVLSGTRIRMRATIVDVTPTPNGCRIKVEQTLERENEERPALVAALLMEIARPDGSPGHAGPNR